MLDLGPRLRGLGQSLIAENINFDWMRELFLSNHPGLAYIASKLVKGTVFTKKEMSQVRSVKMLASSPPLSSSLLITPPSQLPAPVQPLMSENPPKWSG
jgi:hypothetical protein